jgi:CHAD domain-containing protein
MAYKLKRKEKIRAAIKRISREQLGKALRELRDEEMDLDEKVHQVRKRMKKMRGLLRIARGVLGDTYKRENAFFRDAARGLSSLRDAGAVLETIDKLAERFESEKKDRKLLEIARKGLVNERDELIGFGCTAGHLVAGTISALEQALKRVEDWQLEEDGFCAMRPGLKRTYKRGRKAMEAAYSDPSPEAFHEWRKRVKYHWYHARLLSPVWPGIMENYGNTVKLVADLLGDNHDLDVLGERLDAAIPPGDDYDQERMDELIRIRREELAHAAWKAGERIYAEKPGEFCDKIEKWYDSWKRAGAIV